MKHLLKPTLFLLLLGLSWSSFAQEIETVGPFIVLEVTGKPDAITTQGKKMCMKPGAVFLEGGTIELAAGEKVTFSIKEIIKTIDTPGTYVLDEETAKGSFSMRSFDPIFASFVNSSWRWMMYGKDNQGVQMKIKNLGDGWGAGDPGGDGGWGANDPSGNGGWGANDPSGNGGWGAKDPSGNGGWGVKDPSGAGGWGVKDPSGAGGWGTIDPGGDGGWGVKDPTGAGGWGAKDPSGAGGWGVKDPGGDGGWGAKDPGGNGGWGAKDPSGQGGWGVEDMTILPASPGGIYSKGKHTLTWVKEEGVKEYLFVIFDQDLNLIYSKVAKKNVQLDFGKLSDTTAYYWQVFAKNKRAISKPVVFSVASKDTQEEALKLCIKSKTYLNGDVVTQGLMKAVAYENANMYLDAYETYQRLQQYAKKNSLNKMSFAGFCLRLGQTEQARKIVRKL